MKKIIFIFLIMSTIVFPHKERVHQHITREAYYLLENSIGNPITQMKQHLGSFGDPHVSWKKGTILAGAWMEDHDDVVWKYGIGNGWDPSITHFWDPDEGDNVENLLQIYTGYIGPYPNSYTKIRRFYVE